MANDRPLQVTLPSLARRLGISPDKVLTWIHAGELRAINVAADPYRRPRYRIEEAATPFYKQCLDDDRCHQLRPGTTQLVGAAA